MIIPLVCVDKSASTDAPISSHVGTDKISKYNAFTKGIFGATGTLTNSKPQNHFAFKGHQGRLGIENLTDLVINGQGDGLCPLTKNSPGIPTVGQDDLTTRNNCYHSSRANHLGGFSF